MPLFSRKSLLTHGKRPLRVASRVITASSASATSVFSKAWVHSTNRTTALLRKTESLRRAYSTGTGRGNGPSKSLPLYRKVISAWTDTPTKWYPIPLAVGAILLVVVQYRKKSRRARREVEVDEHGRDIIKLKGPWQVHVLGALPLRNMSRVWGYVNSLELPIWFRPYGIKIYAYTFGCNLEEIDPVDLRQYASLGEFFYRKLKDGARPVDGAILVSPADGKILHFGTIQDSRVEQVKGITYSLDALLGVDRFDHTPTPAIPSSDMEVIDDREFADINGIEYSLQQLLGSSSPVASSSTSEQPAKHGEQTDESVVEKEKSFQETLAHDTSVALEMGVKPTLTRSQTFSSRTIKDGNSLFFAVIYLAPGDYHRFHSPTAWVVEKRRHFVGELFSVSPYIAKRLENLFVLNERVALLGRWRHGFFSMVPVGATNVGSIKVNFDQALRTNVRGKPPPPGTYTEATYSHASPILNGQPLVPAQEMGGFCLGSTIVLVFEAPKNFEFDVKAGQKVQVGQKLGDVVPS